MAQTNDQKFNAAMDAATKVYEAEYDGEIDDQSPKYTALEEVREAIEAAKKAWKEYLEAE